MITIFTILAAPILRPKGIPIVTWYAHRQVTSTLKLAHHFSDGMISSDAASYPYDKRKLTIVGQGIDTELFSPSNAPVDNPPLLLSVGRISPIKDLLTLVEAFRLLRQRGHNLRCALVGSSPNQRDVYADEVRHKVQALNLQDSVQFVGPVRQSPTYTMVPAGFCSRELFSIGSFFGQSRIGSDGLRKTESFVNLRI